MPQAHPVLPSGELLPARAPHKRPRIALVDDEPVLIESLQPLLEPLFDVVGFSQSQEALRYLSANPVSVVVADYRMPKMDGIEMLTRLKSAQPDTVRILFTAYGDLDCLTRAINDAGVFHYIPKDRLGQPGGFEEICNLLGNAAELYLARTELKVLFQKLASESTALEAGRDTVRNPRLHLPGARSFKDLIGTSAVIQRVIQHAQVANQLGYDVHISGETGTGKEILAQAIHHESNRRGGPFIAVNCGGLAKELVASEFFGHRKGAFTGAVEEKKGVFEAADRGTIFLDEVGELPPDIQPMLLRVLQEREVLPIGYSKARPVNMRLISATNRDLVLDAKHGRFRHDLLHRLKNGVQIVIPPLRERKEDVPVLAQHFFRQEYPGDVIHGISSPALDLLESYSFPGNVRELSNVVKQAIFSAVLNGHSWIEPCDLPFVLASAAAAGEQNAGLREMKRKFARGEIMESLRQNEWHIARTAEKLSISREWLSKLMKQYTISKPQGLR